MRDDLLLVDLLQYEPAVVPAANTVWVSDYHGFGLIESFGAEGILLGEASKFVEQVVGVDIVSPCSRHWFCNLAGV